MMSSSPPSPSPPRHDALLRVGAKTTTTPATSTTAATTTEEATTTEKAVRRPGACGRGAPAACACHLVPACAALAASLLWTALPPARTRRDDARPPPVVAPGGAPTSAGGGGATPGAGAPTATATATPAPAPAPPPAPARPAYAPRPEPGWIDARDCNPTHRNATNLLDSTNSTGPPGCYYLNSTDGLHYRDVDCADVALEYSTAWDLRHYYNYNATAGSRFGPPAWGGVDVESWATNETSDVTYGAGGNYWSQFDNEAFLENRCDVVDGTAPQSPVDVCDRPSGHCVEFHEIRTRVSLVAMGAVHPDAFGMRLVELSVVVADREETIAPFLSIGGCRASRSFVRPSSFPPRPSASSSHSSAHFATASSSSFALLVRSSQFRAGITASGTTRT